MTDRLRITNEDLQQSPQRPVVPQNAVPIAIEAEREAWFRSAWFYMPCAALCAAFLGSVLNEVLFSITEWDRRFYASSTSPQIIILPFVRFALLGGLVAAALASVEMWVVGVGARAMKYAAFGFLAGAIIAPIGVICGGLLAQLALVVFSGDGIGHQIVFRSIIWCGYGAGVGLAAGLPIRVFKAAMLGLIGGAAGGAIAGALFDPLALLLNTAGDPPVISRVAGEIIFAIAAAFSMVAASQLVRQAWVRVVAGPLAGKQFVLYRDTTTIGSVYESDIFLFKDPVITGIHAEIRRLPGGYEVVARGLTGLNGFQIVSPKRLSNGDRIQLGSTMLEYHARS
ncbi:MAG: FHA domain-containing protein [Phycisphaerales bacterium]|nr:FHA domain-containing protein [Phycisphaerales bacterium]